MSSSIPQTSGIYKIICIPTGKIYVGSAVNLHKRRIAHWNELRRGKHKNSYLQHAWNKYGESAFEFVVLELILSPFLLEREQYWLDKTKSHSRKQGFNISPSAGSMYGYKASEETRRKISESHRGRPHPPTSQETRDKIASTLRGRKLPPEVGRKVSAALKGKPKPVGFGEAQSVRQLGVPKSKHRPETIAKMSMAQRNRLRDPNIGKKISEGKRKTYLVVNPEGHSFVVPDMKVFCREHSLDYGTMMKVARGEQSRHKGWGCHRL